MEGAPPEGRAEATEGAGEGTARTRAEDGMEGERAGDGGESAVDFDFLCCILQPPPSKHDAAVFNGVVAPDPRYYVGMRRLLLRRKAENAFSAVIHRKEWRCNGRGYVAYRNYIRRPRNWDSRSSTPGNSGRWAPSSPLQSVLFDAESWSSSRDLRSVNHDLGRRTSFCSSASDIDHPVHFAEPAYSFAGMHCIFDSCKVSVTIVKFGHMSSDLLAYGSSDGSLSVCRVTETPPILLQLRGHSKDVTDFDFASNNQYIASSSLDKTVRVWEMAKGSCVRVIYGVSPQLCIRFHPVNNNFLSVGNANREMSVINFSTGRVINKAGFKNEITAMDNDHTGQLIFAGDSQGCIYSVSINSHTGSLSRSHRHRSSSKNRSAVATVQYRTFSLLAHGPVLLVCYQDGNLSLFSIALEVRGYLSLRCSLKLAPRLHKFRASFCPLLSLEKGEFIGIVMSFLPWVRTFVAHASGMIQQDQDVESGSLYETDKESLSLSQVSGSEDSNVYFYDLTRPKHPCVNKLQGHSSPVIGIAWNHGENLLASSDSGGAVIVWRRAKNG